MNAQADSYTHSLTIKKTQIIYLFTAMLTTTKKHFQFHLPKYEYKQNE